MSVYSPGRLRVTLIAALSAAALQLALPQPLAAVELPAPCIASACGGIWVASGVATGVQSGNSFTINQASDRAILNWQSFNIGADSQVTFNQPGAESIALNRIFDANPSRIFGSLKANGQLYLLNQNGFLFGATARVNTGGLLASSLNIDTSVFIDGLLSAASQLAPALSSPGNQATILVAPGAQLVTNAANQRILLAAKAIDNQGNLTANDGQVVLAAGEKVYVAASDDPKLRGLLVEVDGGGTVTNSGVVSAERGNITAVGLAVNQNGRVSATTSVAANGSVRLLARDRVTGDFVDGRSVFKAQRGGALTLGSASLTEVNVDAADASLAIDEQAQSPSRIELSGQTVRLAGGSRIQAAGGELSVVAASDPSRSRDNSAALDGGARIRVDAGASIDLAGSSAMAAVTRNLVAVELRSNELANAPLQRDGVLRGQTVVIDARVGTPLADVSSALTLTGRDVLERTSRGGSAVFDSAGDIVVAEGAVLDVSGGRVNYTGGVMQTTQLIRADGSTIDIGRASPDATYISLINPVYKLRFDRWGVVQLINSPGIGHFEQGYSVGADAGSLQFMANAMVLNGEFRGNSFNGASQRTSATMSRGGQFIVGVAGAGASSASFRAPEINLVNQLVPTSVGPTTSLPTGTPLYLATDFLRRGGFSRVQLASDRRVALTSGTQLELLPGASLGITAPRIDIAASIAAPAGSLAFNAATAALATLLPGGGLRIGDGLSLDVSGRWVNDSLVPPDQTPTGLLLTGAGGISLRQTTERGTLQIGNGVALLANGGGWLRQSGVVAGGAGGSISILSANEGTADRVQRLVFGDGLRAEAFGVNGAAGGSFALRAPRLRIADNLPWLGAQQVATDIVSGGALQLGTALFSDFGFRSFALQADHRALAADTSATVLELAPGAQLRLSPQTLILDATAGSADTGATIRSLSSPEALTDNLAPAASLTLSAITELDDNTRYGKLAVGTGAIISANAGSSVSLASSGDLSFSGGIDITSGRVTLATLTPSADVDRGYFDRRLTLNAGAHINVPGGTVLTPNDTGLRTGQVLDGGSVALTAGRGSVEVRAGSVIDVSGASAALDVLPPQGGSYQRIEVGSVGGSLTLQAQESIALQGQLHAAGGLVNEVRNTGGTLSVSLLRASTGNPVIPYPAGPRSVLVQNEVPATQTNGVAAIGAALVKNSGVATLNLAATDEVALAAGLELQLERVLSIDAPRLAVQGSGSANASAGLIIAGPQFTVNALPEATTGAGILNLRAQQIDLRGSLALRNIGQASLTSTGDVSLRGYGNSEVNAAVRGGRLLLAGDLNIAAQRVVPTTGSSYTISAPGRSVSFSQLGAAAGVPLSVGGSLTVNAANIVQGGTLHAPFGQISLNATGSLRLQGGSLTSVSGSTLLPYGRVDNGNSWVWGTDPASATPVAAIPDRRIALTGSRTELEAGAVVDVAGGGDLLAYQYTPGTGGKLDVLDPTVTSALKNSWVILPGVSAEGAYDPMMWAGSNLQPGQSIHVGAGSAVAAGDYQLLPARYALLPGAWLVSAVPGYQDLPTGTVATTTDGAPIVAGYVGFGTQPNAAARSSGFAIRPGSYARQLAQYDDRLASTFFAQQPVAEGAAATNLPRDAGTLVLATTQSLNALATVRAAAAAGGRNASVQIAAPNIEVHAGTVVSGSTGSVHLAADTLQSWNAGSLLLGAKRDAVGQLEVASGNVIVHGGATLSADEVVLAANAAISIENGAAVVSNSDRSGVAPAASRFATPTTTRLAGAAAGAAAVLAVSDLGYLNADRGGATASGGATITVASGGRVATRGAVMADAGGAVALADGAVSAPGASWSLGAARIALGGGAATPGGLTVGTSLQSALQSARAIALQSAGDVELRASTALGNAATTEQIRVQASRINNTAGNGELTLTAGKIVLEGAATAGASSVGAGTASLNAANIELGNGLLALSGFQRVTANASGAVTGTGTGGLTTAGQLEVNAAAMTVASGANTTLAAAGDVTLGRVGTAAPAGTSLPMGGTLQISGDNLTDRARLLAPSGSVTLTAARDLLVDSGASIDVAGYRPALATSSADGGRIELRAGGSIRTAGDATLDVSAGTGADAGVVRIDAAGAANLGATLRAATGSGGAGGALDVRAGSLASFAATQRQAELGGFSSEQRYRVGSGDLQLDAGSQVTARDIELTADTGAVTVNGALRAVSDVERSSIIVNARNDVSIGATAVLTASAAQPATQRGGSITLATTTGSLRFAATADMQAAGAQQSGSLMLRAPATATDMALAALPASLARVDQVYLEPVKSYALSAAPTVAELGAIRTSVNTYVAAAGNNLLGRAALSTAGSASLRPFIDMTRAGDLALAGADFAPSALNWRFGGQAATLSFRASGNLTVNGTLSDGFQSVDTFYGSGLDLLGAAGAVTRASSFNLVAGADLTSASVRGVLRGSSADLQLRNGSSVRTGAGDLWFSAARDVSIGAGSSIYTGGMKAGASIDDDGEFLASFPTRGGSILVNAGRDVVGSTVVQSVNDWQPHWAPYKLDGSGPQGSSYWGIDAAAFGWNVGALGGGDVRVISGRDVRDLSAAVADSSASGTAGRVNTGTGNLRIDSARDINTGYFYVARGSGRLRAGGRLGASGNRLIDGRAAGTLLLAGDASYRLRATGDVLFEGLAQPTLFDPTRFSFNNESFVYNTRYGSGATLAIQSGGGDVAFRSGNVLTSAAFAGVFEADPWSLYPATVSLSSYGRDLNLLGGFIAAPSATGGVAMYAARDLNGGQNAITMSDVTSATSGVGADNVANDGAAGIAQRLGDNTANVLHAADGIGSAVAAGRDVVGLILSLAEATRLAAGRDVRNVGLDTQQSGALTTTSVSAGRDVEFSREAATRELRVGGSGLLEVVAGRNINLGFSKGIATTGRLLNGNLPQQAGASVIALAGLAQPLGIDSFLTAIVGGDAALQAGLIATVAKQTARSGLDFNSASTEFRGWSREQQLPFLVDALFVELVAAGHEAVDDPNLGFERGFAALAALFPGSASASAPVAGNVSMPFSRIYTLAGGSVSILAPGGGVDVGLANPPTFSTNAERLVVANRRPSDLGVVAQQAGSVRVMANADVLVNTSRIFTLGGGDIAIWSSTGNIDAGKGAKSSISAPPPTLTVDAQGNVSINVGSAVAGSGIRTIVTDKAVTPGNVDLMAPAGFVNAGDAGIGSAGNLNIAAQRVVGLDNIQVGGTSTGVPPQVSGLGASLSGVTAAAGSSTTAASNSASNAANSDRAPAAMADIALSWLEVFVTGLGEENCRQDDLECLKRQIKP